MNALLIEKAMGCITGGVKVDFDEGNNEDNDGSTDGNAFGVDKG